MSMIFPAGKNKISWAPVNKTAEEEDAEVDSQFEAIKNLPGIKDEASTIVEEVKEVVEEVKQAIDKVVEVVEQKVDPVGKAEDKKDDGVASVDVAALPPAAGDEVVEIEVALDDEPAVPGVKEDGKVEIEKEGIKACSAKKEEKKDAKKDEKKEEKKPEDKKEASSKPEFQKVSELSPENRKELRTYWEPLFGKEFTDAMLKEYQE